MTATTIADERLAEGTRAGTGLVLAWDGVADIGRGYARALSRPFGTVPDRESWPDIAAAAVGAYSSVLVLVRERQFDFSLANQFMREGAALRLPIGVLALPDDQGDAEEFTVRAVRHWRSPVPAPHRLALYCDFRTSAPAPFPWAFGSTGSDAFIDRLRSGVDAVVLHSHGNGADFRVGEHVLCLQADRFKPAPGLPGERCLPCQAGGFCRLDHRSRFRAFHGVSAVRARLMVLLSCSAYQPRDGLLEPRFQFARRMISHGGHTAGLVASTRINHQTPQLGVAVARLLDRGASLGEVAMRINLLSSAPPSYLCVGDPDLRLTGTGGVLS